MRFSETPIAQLFVVELEMHQDERGFLARAWCSQEFGAQGLLSRCVQANLVYNARRGVLRGMHFQLPPHADAKLVRVVRGAIHDVVLDVRRESRTFGCWFSRELSAANRQALLIPEGCAHGYLTLTDDTELFYLHSAPFDAGSAAGIYWNCTHLQGAWPFPPTCVSDRDRSWPRELPPYVFRDCA